MATTVQSGIFRGFTPPPMDSMLSQSFFNDILSNVFTLGTSGVRQNVRHQYRLRELEKEQTLLLQKLNHLEDGSKALKQHLEELIGEALDWGVEAEDETLEEAVKDLGDKIEQLLLKKEELNETLDKEEAPSETWMQTASFMLPPLIQLAGNFSSLGMQNCCENQLLSNRIKLVKAQNDYLEQKHTSLKTQFDDFFNKNINLLKTGMEARLDLSGIKHTDSAKAYYAVAESKKELQMLKDKQRDLQKEFDTLETQYKSAKEAEKKLNTLKLSFDGVSKENQSLRNQIKQLKDKQIELDKLRQQIKNQANRVQNLDQDFENLQKRIGPVIPKYKPTQKELEALEREGKKSDYFPDTYIKRYNGLKTASEVFQKGFAYALKKIYEMAEKDKDKMKLNRSLDTPSSRGAQVVYRFLVLDWVQRGKIVITCHGYYELHLNHESVKMVPSLPENILKQRDVDGKLQYSIGTHFQARDDFTPSEDVLKNTSAARGIDPIAAKCLLVALSNEEQKYLFNVLLEPAIEDDQPDYLAAIAFINKQPKRKQELFYILRDLISDIAVSLEAKFNQGEAMIEWQPYLNVLDIDLQPFVKKEKEDPNVPTPITNAMEEEGQLIPWQIQFDVLSGIDSRGVAQQGKFCELVMNAQETYQVYFRNLRPGLLKDPLTTDKVINSVTWNQIERLFYQTHQLIGWHGCLLSNVLAVIMVDSSELTDVNVCMLKVAMANYLDDPGHAEEFEGAIKNDFKCTVEKFQAWLRGKNHFLNHIELTTTVLEIAAYTLGVRIALFSPPAGSQDRARTKAKADAYGRLLPVEHIMGHYYGPPTEEVFFLAVEDNYTYYGLFPKLKLDGADAKKLGIDALDFAVFKNLQKYWEEIREN